MFSSFLWIVEAGGSRKELMKRKLETVDATLVVALRKELQAKKGLMRGVKKVLDGVAWPSVF